MYLLILSRVQSIKVVYNNNLYQEDADYQSSTEKPSDIENITPGVGYIHNVSLTPDSTICFKIKTFQFYQFYKAGAYHGPQQAFFSLRDTFILTTYATIPCEEFYPGCTSHIQGYLGNSWKHGKTLLEIQGSPNRHPTWTPNTWNSICVVMKSDKKILYINDAVIEESSHVFTDTITSFSFLNGWHDSENAAQPVRGAFTNLTIWTKYYHKSKFQVGQDVIWMFLEMLFLGTM